jgi:hypothetical protein
VGDHGEGVAAVPATATGTSGPRALRSTSAAAGGGDQDRPQGGRGDRRTLDLDHLH